jgi:hypothetical protein
MKNLLWMLLLSMLFYTCTSTKSKIGTRYFDENDHEIAESKFKEIRSTNQLLDIQGDSINHKKLTIREQSGKLSNKSILMAFLEMEFHQKIDSTKPLVIIYYPGKDPCNSSGHSDRYLRKLWFKELEDGIFKIAQTKPIYIYKTFDGLEKYKGILTWHQDPKNTIERLFFKHHYPCSSFVVISKEGNFRSYFGEFSKESVWKATQIMSQ